MSRAAAAADSNKILHARFDCSLCNADLYRIAALERERDSIRVLLDAERKRTSDLAQVVMVVTPLGPVLISCRYLVHMMLTSLLP